MAEIPSSNPLSSLPRRRKNAVFGLSFLALVILGVWIWQFNSRLSGPFKPDKAEVAAAEQAAREREAAALLEKSKDTDGDGLIDRDEINVYKTSPYLTDTDGDGISDFDEVRSGTDPLCAEGSNCGLLAANPEEIVIDDMEIPSASPASFIDEELLILALSGEGDAQTMRQILLQGGADVTQVDLLSDEDLMVMYKDILAAQFPELSLPLNQDLNQETVDNSAEIF